MIIFVCMIGTDSLELERSEWLYLADLTDGAELSLRLKFAGMVLQFEAMVLQGGGLWVWVRVEKHKWLFTVTCPILILITVQTLSRCAHLNNDLPAK